MFNHDFLFKFNKLKLLTHNAGHSIDDFSDRLNYKYTFGIMIFFISILTLSSMFFNPIQCWIPAEWPKPWEEYVENYCWIQDTYFANVTGNLPTPEERKLTQLSYYQWVPFVMAAQAFLFLVPHLIWKQLSKKSGYDVKLLLDFADQSSCLDQNKREKNVKIMARILHHSMESRNKGTNRIFHHRETIMSKLRMIVPCFWVGGSSGAYLIGLFLSCKVFYMANAIGQLFLMQKFLGFDSVAFGWQIAMNFAQEETWIQSGLFPRVTFCDVPIRRIGQREMRTIQCVLPYNMINEKFFVFLWFWFIICAICSFNSIIEWIISTSIEGRRESFVRKKLQNIISDSRDPDAKIFIREFLRHDGVFIMRIISTNIGEVLAQEILREIWAEWEKKHREKEANESDDDANDEETPFMNKPSAKPSAPPPGSYLYPDLK